MSLDQSNCNIVVGFFNDKLDEALQSKHLAPPPDSAIPLPLTLTHVKEADVVPSSPSRVDLLVVQIVCGPDHLCPQNLEDLLLHNKGGSPPSIITAFCRLVLEGRVCWAMAFWAIVFTEGGCNLCS